MWGGETKEICPIPYLQPVHAYIFLLRTIYTYRQVSYLGLMDSFHCLCAWAVPSIPHIWVSNSWLVHVLICPLGDLYHLFTLYIPDWKIVNTYLSLFYFYFFFNDWPTNIYLCKTAKREIFFFRPTASKRTKTLLFKLKINRPWFH